MKASRNEFNLERAFDRLTMGTITILSLTILLLLAALVLYSRLQTAAEDNNYELLAGVEELQGAADDLQDTLDTLSLLPNDDRSFSSELDHIGQRLDEIDETLEIIEDNIQEIALVDVAAIDTDDVPPSTQEIEDIQQRINQIFFVVTYLIGGISLITSLVLLGAVRSRAKRRYSLIIPSGSSGKWDRRH